MTPKRRIVPVFVPHLGCPNDCIFCNQRRISGHSRPATPDTVRAAIAGIPDGAPSDAPIQLAFYGGSLRRSRRPSKRRCWHRRKRFSADSKTRACAFRRGRTASTGRRLSA
jgi:hypothetical protein